MRLLAAAEKAVTKQGVRMTIQAGLTGPPSSGGELRVRAWSDRPSGAVRVSLRGSGDQIPGASITEVSPGPSKLPRRVFEIAGLPPDLPVTISIADEECHVLTPPDDAGELRVLLASCFYIEDDRGQLASAYAKLRPHEHPHLRLHCGDQLYLDAGALPDAPTAFDRTLARYRRYWEDDRYTPYLRDGAILFTPDDHDYWNDFPYLMPHLRRSWGDQWEDHRDAGFDCYYAYQALGHPDGRTWFALDVGAVSMFVLDTRTNRGSNDRNPPLRLFDADQRQALLDWSGSLEKPGLLVSPMPLFQQARGKVLFFTTDHNHLAFPADAGAIWDAVERAPHDILVLAGDIHQARVTEWRTGTGPTFRRRMEVVSSPLRLLGWPVSTSKRKKPRVAPSALQLPDGRGRRDPYAYGYATTADHFTLLRFRRVGADVRVLIEARRIPDANVAPNQLVGPVTCTAEVRLR